MAPHSDGVDHVSFVLAGSLTEKCALKHNDCAACSLVAKPAEAVHATSFGRAGAHILKIERQTNAAELDDWDSVVNRYVWRHEGAYSGLAYNIYRQFLLDDAGSSLSWESLCLELVGLLGRCRAELDDERHTQPWLGRCIERIRARPFATIRTSALALELGLHPVYLARAFRRRFRCSLSEYIRRVRIENAARELASNSEPLCQVALSAGFADQAHFTREFKAYTGFTPGRFRAVHASRTKHGFIAQ